MLKFLMTTFTMNFIYNPIIGILKIYILDLLYKMKKIYHIEIIIIIVIVNMEKCRSVRLVNV